MNILATIVHWYGTFCVSLFIVHMIYLISHIGKLCYLMDRYKMKKENLTTLPEDKKTNGFIMIKALFLVILGISFIPIVNVYSLYCEITLANLTQEETEEFISKANLNH